MNVTVSELEKERAALQQSWRALAPNIQQARQIEKEASKKPELLRNPRNEALVRWFDKFAREIVALETLYAAEADPSFDLQSDNVMLAREGADKLLDALQDDLKSSWVTVDGSSASG
jgi:hypothetical protein